MRKISKRLQQAKKDIEGKEICSLQEAMAQIEKFPKTKFDESVELHFHLNINPKNTEQMVRGTVVLPHGTGKKIRIAVFCKGELEQKAKEAGADYIGAQELIDKVAKGFLDFDVVVASPDMMRDLSKLGRVLGPRGLMPTPKAGTVTQDVEKAINDLKAGKIVFKSDKQAGIHLGVGKRSFKRENLLENIEYVVEAVKAAKPNSVKGQLLKGMAVTTTMGPGIKVAI